MKDNLFIVTTLPLTFKTLYFPTHSGASLLFRTGTCQNGAIRSSSPIATLPEAAVEMAQFALVPNTCKFRKCQTFPFYILKATTI